MKYRTLNGKEFEAASHEEAAQILWQMMLVPEPTIEEWMQGSAQRARAWNGSVISTSSVVEHVEGLIEFGILEVDL